MTENGLIDISAMRQLVEAGSRGSRENILDALHVLDLRGGEAEQPIDAALSDLLWRMSQHNETVSALDQAYLIYRLRQPVQATIWIDGRQEDRRVERWMLWESWLANGDGHHNPDYEWARFCRDRLNVGPEAASQRKRIWEVFHITLGMDREKMERAGISKLAQAVGQVARDWEAGGVDEELMALLFGRTLEEEADDGDVEAESLHTEPATHAEVTAHLSNRRAEAESGTRQETVFDFEIAPLSDNGHTARIVCWLRRPADPVSVPVELGTIRLSATPDMTDDERERAWQAFRRIR